ncbi:phage major capsid protein [Nocardioides sp. 503]|uniref:phage major capsid protein n=1 Tax=Nocardioides sp. 503 TaxID=2508326 RepID=UPI00106F1341|nr:phage major capsid protein [Nocardioides sp. 503]
MNPIETLRGQIASTWNQMETIMATARAEERSLTDEERATYDGHAQALTTQRADLARMEAHERNQAAGSTPAEPSTDPLDPTPATARSLGDHFVNSAREQLTNADSSSRFTISAPEFRNAASDVQVTDGTGGSLGAVLTEVDTTIVTGVRRRMTIEDLLDSGTISGQAITYFVEGALEGDFTTVAENGAKPQLHFANPTAVTDALKKIAGFIKESDELIEDLPFLASAINNRLLYQLDLFTENQILNGNGTGTNLRGLLQRSGIQSLGVIGDPAPGNADRIFQAITAVSTGAGLEADGIVINPVDYQAFRLKKDGNGQYMGGGFFSGQYGVGGVLEEPPLWGKRTVVTPAIAAGTVLVGAFRTAATVYTKGGTRVEATNSDQDDFTNNRITIRAERRKALAVRRPAGLVKVTLGAA